MIHSRVAKPTILVVPGWTNSGPDHWQSHWEAGNSSYRRVTQRDWDDPDPAEWIAALDDAVSNTQGPIVLVAHSLGCITVARWVAHASRSNRSKIAGAFLVAPSDVDRPDVPAPLRQWRPVPAIPLPFPSLLIASRSDEYLAFARAQDLAGAWGSELMDAGDAGHLNTAAGYGPWPEGQRLLDDFVDRVSQSA